MVKNLILRYFGVDPHDGNHRLDQSTGWPDLVMAYPQKPILIVLHQENSNPGRVAQALRARGYRLDIRKPRFGDPLPETMQAHAGAIVFGGPMSANDNEDYIRVETDWFRVPLREQAPVLGICLGAQMMARHLGAQVFARPDGHVEIGYYPISPTPCGCNLTNAWPDKVYQWHREGHDLPAGATLLAQSDLFACQAYRYGPAAFGIQFHVELTLAMVHRWTVRGAARLTLPGARPRGEHFAERAIYDAASRTWLERFLSQWLESDARARNDAPACMAAGT